MKSFRLFLILLVFTGNFALLLLWLDQTLFPAPLSDNATLLRTPPPAGATEATLNAEMTAVACFTLEPEAPTSYTLYFVEIIARNLTRPNLSATAIAMLTPTASHTATPTVTPKRRRNKAFSTSDV